MTNDKCAFCGIRFINNIKTKIYCSLNCRSNNWIKNNKEKRKKHLRKYNKSEKGKLTNKKYRMSEKGKMYKREYEKKYLKTKKGQEVKQKSKHIYINSKKEKLKIKEYNITKRKENNKKYRQTEYGQKKIMELHKKYLQTEKGQEVYIKASKKYYKSEKGKLMAKKKQAKRKRQLNFIPIMNNPYPKEIKVEWHHINNMFVIPIPEQWHLKGGKRECHRNVVNSLIQNNGFEIEVFT